MLLTLKEAHAAAERFTAVKTYGHFIDGQWVGGNGGETIPQINPATRQVIAHVQAGDAVDADRAVQAAHRAFPSWSRLPAAERQRMLLAIANRLRERRLDYAMMEALNNGKPISEAYKHDMSESIGLFDYYAGAAWQVHGTVTDFPDSTMLVHREAIGVVAQIIPWNVPLLMACQKLAPALAAGCTIVLKPAETTCISVLEFMNDLIEFLPPGVVNVVTGYGHVVGEPLVTHPLVRKVTFTGSRATAQKIIAYAARNIIPQTMELGGKSANIVCEDADLDAAAESVVISTVFNKGEVCLAGSRVFVHKKVEDKLLDKVSALLVRVRQGDPTDPSTHIGAQASELQFNRVMEYLSVGKSEGAKLVAGGRRADIAGFEDGLFIEPTIFSGVSNDMRIAQEEIFGPVTAFIRWDDEAEMLRQANDSVYGLGGGIWSRNLAQAHRISRHLETGMIWINRYYNFKMGQPIGGYKQSGFGREHSWETLNDYQVTKSVVVNLDEGPIGVFDH